MPCQSYFFLGHIHQVVDGITHRAGAERLDELSLVRVQFDLGFIATDHVHDVDLILFDVVQDVLCATLWELMSRDEVLISVLEFFDGAVIELIQ